MVNLTTPLIGFNREPIRTGGEITLPMTIGERPRDTTNLTRFLIMDTPSPSYNVIIGKPTLNTLQAIIFTVHLKIKFRTAAGIREAQGDQVNARECRCNFLKKVEWESRTCDPDETSIDKQKKRGETRGGWNLWTKFTPSE